MKVTCENPVELLAFTRENFPSGWVESGGVIFLVVEWLSEHEAKAVFFSSANGWCYGNTNKDEKKRYSRAVINEIRYSIL